MTRARDEFTDSGAFVLRTPLLPFGTLDDLSDVGTLARDPLVREAVFLASPSLADDIDEPGARRALLSYVTRMAGRATPFGLFAGCAVGSVGGETSLRLPGKTEVRRHTRLDFGFLAKVVARLVADPAVQPFLVFVPNTSLYRAGARLRMAEARHDGNAVRYHRVTFEEDEFLTATLDRARGGATLDELAQALTDDEVTVEEAREYVRELVEAQLLVSDLGPVVTGDDSVRRIVTLLQRHEETRGYADVLDAADRALDDLDERTGNDPAAYLAIAESLRTLDPDLRVDRLFQVDLARPAPELALGDDVVNELYRAVDLLHPLAPRNDNEELRSFKEAFQARYEQREVPLAEVLDEEIGIGFGPPPALQAEGAPLLAGLVGGGREARGGPAWTASDSRLLTLLTRALTDGATELELAKADFDALKNADPHPLPDALSVAATVTSDGRVVFDHAGGPSGARLLGRFCHLDPGIEKLTRAHVEAEEAVRPDVVFAEVVHLPEGRVGNILARPVLREREIPFLAVSGVEPERQIALDDLLVSVVGDRVVLRSRRLDREVVPRITNAHNHQTGALAVYRFLGALQYQGYAANISWSWGSLRNAPFLPRVTYGRLVLSRALWNLPPDDLSGLKGAKTDDARAEVIGAVRAKARLPRRVVISMGDNDLPVDLDTEAGRTLFAHEAKRGGGLKLVELYPAPDDLVVSSPDGTYVAEIVLPLVRRTPAPRPSVYVGEDSGVESVFLPGSEWLTAKVYTGKATADAVLREAVVPIVGETRDVTDGWFFLRYGDPDHHLRLRFHHGRDAVLNRLHARLRPLLDDGRVSKVVLDTYRREVARYGGPEGILVAEQVFRHDSDAVLAIVAAAEGDAGLAARWRLAVVGVDRLLADGGLDVPARRAAVRRWRDALVVEHGATGENARRHAGKLFRTERADLERLMAGTPTDAITEAGLAALDRRTEAQRPLLAGTREDILGSLSHMHVNRVLRAAQRTQELVVYDLLDRLYAGALARKS
ncbi:MAG TPA: lantibiotic dehydratase [Frankiaceae bacterium]|nr:lantibiotic dehydratase [Frankiaceae bacterium]